MAITATTSPAPDISWDEITSFAQAWNWPEAQMQRMLMGEPMLIKPFTVPSIEHVHTYPDCTKAGFMVNIPFGNKPVPW